MGGGFIEDRAFIEHVSRKKDFKSVLMNSYDLLLHSFKRDSKTLGNS